MYAARRIYTLIFPRNLQNISNLYWRY